MCLVTAKRLIKVQRFTEPPEARVERGMKWVDIKRAEGKEKGMEYRNALSIVLG